MKFTREAKKQNTWTGRMGTNRIEYVGSNKNLEKFNKCLALGCLNGANQLTQSNSKEEGLEYIRSFFLCHTLKVGPYGKFISRWVGKVEPSPSRKGKDVPDDAPPGPQYLLLN